MLTLTLSLALAMTAMPQASNDRCPVTGMDVRNHLFYHHVTVRGQAYYVHDQRAARLLKQCPSCYLAEDGQPINGSLPEASRAQAPK